VKINTDIISDVHTYNLDIANREIYLHGYIGNLDEDPGVEYRMATNLYKNIRLLDTISNDPILIHMHSIGGNWSDGMAIYDAISLCKSYVTIVAYGQAESMSSIILQAADKRVLTPNSHFMLHFGSLDCSGDHLSAHNFARMDKRNTEIMLDIYSTGCLKSAYFKEKYSDLNSEKVKNYLKRKLKDGDWYLNAKDAVHYGFADYVLDTRKCKDLESLK
jgi:ATP-dependent protease ClpP protease subunit